MDRVGLYIVGCDGLCGAGGCDYNDAIKKRGTKAGRRINDPASHREPSLEGTRACHPAPCGALSRDMGAIPVPAKCGKATQRTAQRLVQFPWDVESLFWAV